MTTRRPAASSASPASVSTFESIVIVELAALAFSEIWPRDFGTAVMRRLPTVWSTVTPCVGLYPFATSHVSAELQPHS
jgi:hypothetical protein